MVFTNGNIARSKKRLVEDLMNEEEHEPSLLTCDVSVREHHFGMSCTEPSTDD
ncbi:hypothetical protein PICMEDRAFT_74882 [Pichia membranifaciens NRRL Y-2026]|uniref:Uncharacterized protein n=1 Tax=Pichia membranifaciens NRRL Y-2026 TaxID=763406 RepID=A0A1E3NFC3_9ASCO|nr:hypothetical protein PICMEDRAFT_74882 [Pichia membranifaciens NRRL Y-2026]ODQ44278.1 hypothetical protein PICMEDRAFT_74882 [Pichia membranifaciens NRRL Y-2026]